MVQKIQSVLADYKRSVSKINNDWSEKKAAAQKIYTKEAYNERWVPENKPMVDRTVRLLKSAAVTKAGRYGYNVGQWVNHLISNSVNSYYLNEISCLRNIDLSGFEIDFFLNRYTQFPICLRAFVDLVNERRSPLNKLNINTFPDSILPIVNDALSDAAKLIELYAVPDDFSSKEGIARYSEKQIIEGRFADYKSKLDSCVPFLNDSVLNNPPELSKEELAQIDNWYRGCTNNEQKISRTDALLANNPNVVFALLQTSDYKYFVPKSFRQVPDNDKICKLAVGEKYGNLRSEAIQEELGIIGYLYADTPKNESYDARTEMTNFLNIDLSGNDDNSDENETEKADNTAEKGASKPEN